ncbi:hypothetical protein GCM10009610_25910 [Pseudonocardia xinjiangensis]
MAVDHEVLQVRHMGDLRRVALRRVARQFPLEVQLRRHEFSSAHAGNDVPEARGNPDTTKAQRGGKCR